MYTDCKLWKRAIAKTVLGISTRPCIQIARGWDTFPALSDLVPPFSQTSFGGPLRRRTPRGFALREVSCWTYFLPGFCRAVPVISTPALLSLGRSKRTRLCCCPILRRGVFLIERNFRIWMVIDDFYLSLPYCLLNFNSRMYTDCKVI